MKSLEDDLLLGLCVGFTVHVCIKEFAMQVRFKEFAFHVRFKEFALHVCFKEFVQEREEDVSFLCIPIRMSLLLVTNAA